LVGDLGQRRGDETLVGVLDALEQECNPARLHADLENEVTEAMGLNATYEAGEVCGKVFVHDNVQSVTDNIYNIINIL
jgi:hypothetical protein